MYGKIYYLQLLVDENPGVEYYFKAFFKGEGFTA
jgi:hypothetical protein